jgi:hypothetical protein
MISVFANGVSRHSVVAFFGLHLHRPGKAGGHGRTGELEVDARDIRRDLGEGVQWPDILPEFLLWLDESHSELLVVLVETGSVRARDLLGPHVAQFGLAPRPSGSRFAVA